MTDPRSINALDTEEMFANETATAEELAAAWAAARDAHKEMFRELIKETGMEA